MGITVYPPTSGGANYVNISVPQYTNLGASASIAFDAGNYLVSYSNPNYGAVTASIGATSASLSTTLSSAILSLPTSESSISLNMSSTYGVWAKSTTSPGSNSYYNQIGKTDTGWVAVNGANNIWTTTDGSSWSTLTTSAGFAASAISIAYNSAITQKYVVCCSGGEIYSSTDAITWTYRTTTSNLCRTVAASTTATNKYVVGAADGAIHRSTDGITWSRVSVWASSYPVYSSLWDGSYYRIVGDYGQYYYSTNGQSWTSGNAAQGSSSIESITYQNSMYFTWTSGGYSYSTDGVTWTFKSQTWSSSGGGVKPAVVYLDGYYYTNGGAYRVYRTTSVGSTWSAWGFGDTSSGIIAGNLHSDGNRIITSNGYYTTTGNLTFPQPVNLIMEYTGTATTLS